MLIYIFLIRSAEAVDAITRFHDHVSHNRFHNQPMRSYTFVNDLTASVSGKVCVSFGIETVYLVLFAMCGQSLLYFCTHHLCRPCPTLLSAPSSALHAGEVRAVDSWLELQLLYCRSCAQMPGLRNMVDLECESVALHFIWFTTI